MTVRKFWTDFNGDLVVRDPDHPGRGGGRGNGRGRGGSGWTGGGKPPWAGGGSSGGGGGGADPNIVLNATFASDDEGFTNLTRNAGEGWQFETGYAEVAGNTTSAKSFTAITSGSSIRVDFHVLMTDTTSGATANTALYVLPTSGSIVSSNSVAAFNLVRSSHGFTFQYRDNVGFQDDGIFVKQGWLEISAVIDFDGGTYDIYIQDQLWRRNITIPNGSATDISRVGIANGSTAPTTYFDEIVADADWSLPTESVLLEDDFTVGSGAIEDSTPDTDNVNLYAQPWVVPTGTGLTGFNRTANGLQVATASSRASCWYRAAPDGEFRATWTASATTGNIYGAINLRAYMGDGDPDANGNTYFRYFGGDNTCRLAADSGVIASGTLSGTTVTASNDYTLEVVARGRYYWCYVNDVLQFGGPVLQAPSNDRGQLPEDMCGPAEFTGQTDNYCKDFRVTGRIRNPKTEKTIGDWTWILEPGSVREAYNSGLALTQRDLLNSQGWQFCHVAEYDISPFVAEIKTIYSTTNLLVQRHRGILISEAGAAAAADSYIVLRRDAIWTLDSAFLSLQRTFGPDWDLREDLWDTTFRYIGNAGASTSVTVTSSATAVTHVDQNLPVGHQNVTDMASGDDIRLTNCARAVSTNRTRLITSAGLFSRGGPITIGAARETGPDITIGETITTGYKAILERGSSLALSDSILQGVRDEVASPLTLTGSVGSLNTSEDGDDDTDGFNERFGWYEWTGDGDDFTFTIPGATTTQYYPAVRIESATAGGTISGLTEGTDYWLDDLGDGSLLLQINAVVSANTEYAYTA